MASNSQTGSQQAFNRLPQQQQQAPTTKALQPESSRTQTRAGLAELQQAAAVLKALANEQQQQQQQQNDYPTKREPLGLRQTTTHLQQQQQQSQQQSQVLQEIPNSSSFTSSSSSAALSINEEDQENDISMASLGSDFVPSILHDEASFNEETSFENFNSSITSEQDYNYDDDENFSALVADDELVDIDGEDDIDDEELQSELSQAFKRHDESLLFKSSTYIDDIECYLNKLERVPELRPLPNYMDFQQDIDTEKRATLINWLVEVAEEYQLQTETLFICTGIIDRFLSQMSVSTSNFQLLGVAAMFIASKYEEIYPPYLHSFVEVTDDTYSGQQIRQMEQQILKTLNFRISMPTVIFYLQKIFAFNKFPKKVYHLAEYLCHLSLLSDEPFLEYYPSEIALAAVILAAHQVSAAGSISPELKRAYDASNQAQLERRQLPKGVSLRDIERRSFIVNQELPFCVESLRAIQDRVYSGSPEIKEDWGILVKYRTDTNSRVAYMPAPKVEDLLNY